MEIKSFKKGAIISSLCLTASIYADTITLYSPYAQVNLENNSRKPIYIVVNKPSDTGYHGALSHKANSVPSQEKGVFSVSAGPGQSIYIYEVRNRLEVCRPENFSYPLMIHQGGSSYQERGKVAKISLKVKKSQSKNACKVKLK